MPGQDPRSKEATGKTPGIWMKEVSVMLEIKMSKYIEEKIVLLRVKYAGKGLSSTKWNSLFPSQRTIWVTTVLTKWMIQRGRNDPVSWRIRSEDCSQQSQSHRVKTLLKTARHRSDDLIHYSELCRHENCLQQKELHRVRTIPEIVNYTGWR